jgi:DNA adenine methylase
MVHTLPSHAAKHYTPRRYYSPLRYPGGKRRLTNTVFELLERNGLKDIEYAEPYAGGASLALALLLEEYASVVHINDLSRPVHAFWQTALHETDALCQRIHDADVNMEEWVRQRAVYDDRDSADTDDLGFATLFLNRTNRSGIIGGGVIGGKSQAGAWALDARFNKPEIIRRIRRLARYRDRIKLYGLDARDFTDRVVRKLGPNSLTFVDPPYIERGLGLYMNTYSLSDHAAIERVVASLPTPWLVTYDAAAVEHGLYSRFRRIAYGLEYTAQGRYRGVEFMFFSDTLRLPSLSDLSAPRVHIIPEKCRVRRRPAVA